MFVLPWLLVGGWGDCGPKSCNHKAGLIVKYSRFFPSEIVGWLVGRSLGDSHEKPPPAMFYGIILQI